MIGLNGRFLVFDNNGFFIAECTFDKKPPQKELTALTEREIDEQKSAREEMGRNMGRLQGIDFVTNLVQMEEKMRNPSDKRMILEKISSDQTKYLFIDNENEDLYVYELDYKDR